MNFVIFTILNGLIFYRIQPIKLDVCLLLYQIG